MKIVILLFLLPSLALSQAEIAFTLQEKDLIPEGLAYNPKEDAFYISSINKHKIVKIFMDGHTADFAKANQDGLGEVLGMKVDVNRQHLWVCSNVAENNVYQKALVHQFNLSDGKLIQKYELNEPNNLFNDVDVDASGNVYITNSENNSIYIIDNSKSLKLLIKDAQLNYVNGVALSQQGDKLYVSSGTGLYYVDLKTKELKKLRLSGYHVFGMDGLYRYENSLIGIQNSVFPEVVNQYFFDKSETKLLKAINLTIADKNFRIPTTGAIRNGWLYFIANSQIDNFDNGKVKDGNELKDVVILKVKLN